MTDGDFKERYETLCGLPRAEIAARVREWFPEGIRVHWWWGMVERATARVHPLRGLPLEERADGLALGAAFVTVVRGDDEASRVRAGRWALRFADLAARPGQEDVTVPEELTPDGAVRLALDSLPWPPEGALREKTRWDAEAEEDGTHTPGEAVPPRSPTAYTELPWTLANLEPVLPHLTDPGLKARAETWLHLRPLRRSPANAAVEKHDLRALRAALDAGADVEEAQFGIPLLVHAVDVESDGATQRRTPVHVDMTALLLARGADPTRRATEGPRMSAEELAELTGHWLATELFRAWRCIQPP
ncbi:hypothetical protein ACL02R_17020 [Streptomyces sp. MS19]|uniref:hypothetical protein n=1 Tax=Streptomyces sp. MS19 TaxID=3385972 RepID=UPI0039A03209